MEVGKYFLVFMLDSLELCAGDNASTRDQDVAWPCRHSGIQISFIAVFMRLVLFSPQITSAVKPCGGAPQSDPDARQGPDI